jgi:hypothetical protein
MLACGTSRTLPSFEHSQHPSVEKPTSKSYEPPAPNLEEMGALKREDSREQQTH